MKTLRCWWVVFLLLVLVACDDDDNEVITELKPAHLQLAPASIVFGKTPQGDSQSQEVLLHNQGQLPLKLDSISFEGQEDSFLIVNPPSELEVNGTFNLELTFTPQQSGVLETKLAFIFDGDNSPFLLNITGEGMANPLCAPCDETPASFCMNADDMAFYETTGSTCEDDQCLFEITDVKCLLGCEQTTGKCLVLDGGSNSGTITPPATTSDAGTINPPMEDGGNSFNNTNNNNRTSPSWT